MRELKFRGMAIDGTWRYGGYHKNDKGEEFIIIGSYPDKSIGWCFVPIKPGTVGQFTGLLDKNKKEIYENDIVLAKDHNPDHYRIEFREGGFCGVWGDGDDEWYPVDINHFYDSTGCCIEVIGNIHQT